MSTQRAGAMLEPASEPKTNKIPTSSPPGAFLAQEDKNNFVCSVQGPDRSILKTSNKPGVFIILS